ncbi:MULTISPECIES: hypothetical protein [Sphingobium]|uniref:Uncharacterized protein n=1 Tax=Sphingobium fuliginis (strain ATCC 27551) TaxID=336203 RepID=A0A292ZM25_SPHSA|nr:MULTISPECIES: hypothetical protein [Sphingobium]QOT73750.1 hypothetical protein H5V43_21375 [Sphingobium fuliginis]UXC93220.1 hypothetical protein EGM87_23265 [Sphingobium sp. RSMS]GAY23900.1 hypothetical protein SFOMI_4478 [Sphingobium fuliginis]GFZ98894.1 hypothetical protein GCM10019071_31700 [Sphingobium fuliginis]
MGADAWLRPCGDQAKLAALAGDAGEGGLVAGGMGDRLFPRGNSGRVSHGAAGTRG